MSVPPGNGENSRIGGATSLLIAGNVWHEAKEAARPLEPE
jgi:hypothetical protein